MFQGRPGPFGIFLTPEFFGSFLFQSGKEAEIDIGGLEPFGICFGKMSNQ